MIRIQVCPLCKVHEEIFFFKHPRSGELKVFCMNCESGFDLNGDLKEPEEDLQEWLESEKIEPEDLYVFGRLQKPYDFENPKFDTSDPGPGILISWDDRDK